MSSTPSSLPYTAEEHRVLASYFEREPLVPLDPELTLEVALRRLGYQREGNDRSMATVAVAGIVLQEVYLLLPWSGPLLKMTPAGPSIRDRVFVDEMPSFRTRFDTCELLTIYWPSGRTVSWQETHSLAWLPGYERWLITISNDGSDFGYPDWLQDHFEAVGDPRRRAAELLGRSWRDCPRPWSKVGEDGLIEPWEAQLLAAQAWPQSDEEQRWRRRR